MRNGEALYFDGILTSLLKWARAEGLLHGQANRHHEHLLKRARDRAAHTASYKLVPPNMAALAIADVAEIINRLWGVTASGSRLYPDPVRRTAVVVAWSRDGDAIALLTAERFSGLSATERETLAQSIVVLGQPQDDELFYFDACYEAARTPCEWLWGPCSWKDAAGWLADNQPAEDEVELLDRLFVVRYHDSRLYLPQHPDVVAALDATDVTGTWYLLRADSPLAAFNHLRQALVGGFVCKWKPRETCLVCPLEMIHQGTWQDVRNHLAMLGQPIQPRPVPDVRAPGGWPRWNVIENGHWSVPPDTRLSESV